MALTAQEFEEMAALAAELGDDQAELEALEGLESTGGLGDLGDAIIEPIKAIAGGIGTEIAAGIGGIAQTLNPLAEQGAGAQAVEDIRAAAPDFSPQTQAGQDSMALIRQAVELGIDVTNMSLSGLEGIADLIRGRGLDQAVETIKDIQGRGISANLGDRALEATGSPLAATAAHLLPEALASVGGGIPLARAGAKGAETIQSIGKGLREGAPQAVQAGKDIVKATRSTVKDIARIQTPAKQEIAKQLQSGIIDKDLARFKLAEEGVTDPTEIQKALGVDLPKVVLDKSAINASRQGFGDGFLDSVKKRGSIADRKAMVEMTNIAQRGHKDPLFGADNRPADVAGNVLLARVNEIKSINRKAGKKIGGAKKFLKGKVVPVSSIGDNFLTALDELKIKVVDGKLDFTDSLVSGGGRRRAINDIFGRMVRNTNPDALDLHELKQFIDDTVSYGKTVRGLGGKAEGVLKSLRSDIRSTLEANFPDYAKANKAYSDTIEVLDEIQRLAGKRTDLTSSDAGGQLGILSRRLMSNAQSRGQVRDSIKSLESVLDEHSGFGEPLRIEGVGGDKGPNIKLLMLYADELDRVVGNAAKTSFTGSLETGIKAAKGPKEFIADKAVDAARKVAGISEEGAFKSMYEFLRSIDNKKTAK